MNTTATLPTPSARPRSLDSATATTEQLTLAIVESIPVRFQLDERTRRSGLAHVAALRAQLADQAAARARANASRTDTPRHVVADGESALLAA